MHTHTQLTKDTSLPSLKALYIIIPETIVQLTFLFDASFIHSTLNKKKKKKH